MGVNSRHLNEINISQRNFQQTRQRRRTAVDSVFLNCPLNFFMYMHHAINMRHRRLINRI